MKCLNNVTENTNAFFKMANIMKPHYLISQKYYDYLLFRIHSFVYCTSHPFKAC